MNRNKMWFLSIVIIFAASCKTIKTDRVVGNKANQEIISVEYPESYELANIILALTDYGKADKWEVRKGIDYYEKMQDYFQPVSNHPLLDSVNYSRQRWEEYLSFRTDAYAFVFDENNRLKRHIDFYANEGVNPFDKHLDLINDFVQKSNFRMFFSQNQDYYKRVSAKYKKTQYINEMKKFLTTEFGEQFSSDVKYKVILSPFVLRMNCHRNINSKTIADFITIPDYVLTDTISVKEEDIATSIHNLFTEMDHGYVNPTTDNYNLEEDFLEEIWDDESGYAGNGNGVFNEYMTWAVYDIFNSIHFPELADKINLNWHFQNDTRGFIYSNLFASKLRKLYSKYKGKKKIKDLYPELLEWTNKIQPTLSKPLLLNDSDTIQIIENEQLIELLFSEPMEENPSLDIVFQYSQWDSETIEIGEANNLIWSEDGKSLSFEIKFQNKPEYYFLLNWWGVEKPLKSKKGILLKATSGFVIKGKSAQNRVDGRKL